MVHEDDAEPVREAHPVRPSWGRQAPTSARGRAAIAAAAIAAAAVPRCAARQPEPRSGAPCRADDVGTPHEIAKRHANSHLDLRTLTSRGAFPKERNDFSFTAHIDVGDLKSTGAAWRRSHVVGVAGRPPSSTPSISSSERLISSPDAKLELTK